LIKNLRVLLVDFEKVHILSLSTLVVSKMGSAHPGQQGGERERAIGKSAGGREKTRAGIFSVVERSLKIVTLQKKVYEKNLRLRLIKR
jgi:hypothetical protein